MGLFKRFANFINPKPRDRGGDGYWIVVRCNRCGETIQTHIDMRNDLSVNYGENNSKTTYYCRKVLTGEGRCFQKIEVELIFDKNRNLIDRQIRGGQFIDEK